jgi:beta-lactamase class D
VSPPDLRRTLAALGVLLALAACDQVKSVKLPAIHLPGQAAFDKDKLESAIDAGFGGIGTCVVIHDMASGREVYRYNSNAACMRLLPPCSTFEVPLDLIALDAGAITPTTVLKWDGSPQPIRSWQQDTDAKTAFKESIIWWHASVARKVGSPLQHERLKAFGYGNQAPDGPLASFWLGPSQGGELGISTRQQAEFLRRLYGGRLPVKPASAQFVEQNMVDEIRSGFTISGKTGSCASVADSSRQVGWWAGRLKGPRSDYVFAASIDQASDASLPGEEIKVRAKSAFAQAGLWPAL